MCNKIHRFYPAVAILRNMSRWEYPSPAAAFFAEVASDLKKKCESQQLLGAVTFTDEAYRNAMQCLETP